MAGFRYVPPPDFSAGVPNYLQLFKPQALDTSPLTQFVEQMTQQEKEAFRRQQLEKEATESKRRWDAGHGLDLNKDQRAAAEAARAAEEHPLSLAAKRAQIAQTQAGTGLTGVNTEAARLKLEEARNPNLALQRRAEAAAQYGLKPGTREHNEFVLTGDFPRGQGTAALQFAERETAARSFGLQPGSPAYQSYVLTGKMPREDQQPLTATDKKAILEADEMVLSSEGVIKNLEDAKALSKKAYTGPTAGVRGYATSFVGAEGGKATEELRTLITQNALQQLKATFGAAPTEGERKILLEIQGAVDKEPSVREAIFERARVLAEKRLAFYRKRAEEMRGQSYFKPQTPAGAQVGPVEGERNPNKDQRRLRFNPETGELE
jgi:hypothetical protein